MCIKNLCRSIILIGLTFTLLLGIFTDNVMAANEPKSSGSDIQELNTPLGENEITQSTSKNLPFLQLGDGASNGSQDAVFLLQKQLKSVDGDGNCPFNRHAMPDPNCPSPPGAKS